MRDRPPRQARGPPLLFRGVLRRGSRRTGQRSIPVPQSRDDADQLNAVSLAAYYPFLPKDRAHGKVRNQLFFDWHVTTTKVDAQEKVQ